MDKINEPAGWPDIPLLSTRDLVLGGEEGPSNTQAKAISARLNQLKEDGELAEGVPLVPEAEWGPVPAFKGGPDAPLNRQAQALANRSEYLNRFKSSAIGSAVRTLFERLSDKVSAKDFGIIGDGIADDSDALQKMADAGGIVYVPPGTRIRITRKIRVTRQNTVWFTDKVNREAPLSNGAAEIFSDDEDLMIYVETTTPDFTSKGITYTSPSEVAGRIAINCIRLGDPIPTTASIDHCIRDNNFRRFAAAVRCEGRGLDFQGNVVADCTIGVDLDWPLGFVGSSEGNRGKYAGFRSFHIANNRFHGVVYAVQNTGDNAKNVAAINLINNNLDIGAGIFRGVLRRSMSIGNVSSMANSSGFVYDLRDGSEDYVISDVGMGQRDANVDRTPNGVFRFTGSHKRASLANFVGGHCKRWFFSAIGASFEDFSISGMRVSNPCADDIGDHVFSFDADCVGDICVTDLTVNIPSRTNNRAVFGGNGTVNIHLNGPVRFSNATLSLTAGSVTWSGFYHSPTSRRVGLGTTSPFCKFQVSDPGATNTRFERTSSTGGVGLSFKNDLGGVTMYVTPTAEQTGSFASNADNQVDLGRGPARFRDLFIANAPTVTSDEREKADWREQSAAEKLAAIEIKGLIRAFKFTGRNRIHFGVGAQTVGDVMRSHGLDPADYAFWCYDEWPEQPEIKDEEGNVTQEHQPAGNRYGIRYGELCMFILAAM